MRTRIFPAGFLALLSLLAAVPVASANQYLYEGSNDDANAYYGRVGAPGNLSSWHAAYLGCDPYRMIYFQNSHLGVVRLMRMARSGNAFSVSNFFNVNDAVARMTYENNLDATINSFRCRFIQSFPRAEFAVHVSPGTLPVSVVKTGPPTLFSKTLMGVGKYFSITTKVDPSLVNRPAQGVVPTEPYQGTFDPASPVLPRRIDSAQDVAELVRGYSLAKFISPEVLKPLTVAPPNPNNTVSMVYRNNEVQFYGFNSTGVLTNGVILDGEKDIASNPIVKYIPGNCTTCHGGNPIDNSGDPTTDNGKNVQGLFFPLDYNALKFPKLVNASNPSLGYNLAGTYTDLTTLQQELLWRMNRAASQGNTSVSAFQPTPNGFSPYIESVLYSDITNQSSALPGRVPTDYDNPVDKPNYHNGARQVGCTGCHQARGTNWDSKTTLNGMRASAKAMHNSGSMPFSFFGHTRDLEPVTNCFVRKWIDPTLTENCTLIPIDISIANYPATTTFTQRPTYPVVSVPLESK